MNCKGSRVGFSIAKAKVYCLHLSLADPSRWFVGSTRSFERRMRSYCGLGEAVVTKEAPVAIEKAYALNDCQIATDCAYDHAELIVAKPYANGSA